VVSDGVAYAADWMSSKPNYGNISRHAESGILQRPDRADGHNIVEAEDGRKVPRLLQQRLQPACSRSPAPWVVSGFIDHPSESIRITSDGSSRSPISAATC